MIASAPEQRPMAATPPAICLPGTVDRRGTSLLNQQFWLWGQDIRREGNILLRYGFERHRPPEAVQGSRRYTLQLGADRTLVLWGFGLCLEDRALGSLYLSRFRLYPLLVSGGEALDDVWSPAHLPPCRPPGTAHERASAHVLLVAALHWVSAYESWVLTEMGPAYRAECMVGWKQRACPTDAAAWRRLAQRCDTALRRTYAVSR